MDHFFLNLLLLERGFQSNIYACYKEIELIVQHKYILEILKYKIIF